LSSSAKNIRIIIAGGGTGGHVFPALAIKQALVSRVPNIQVIFAGTKHGLEASILPREGERFELLWISGFSRTHMLRNLLLPVKLLVSFLQCAVLLAKFRPHVVVGTGGYVMGPVLWTAQLAGIPTILQEQNSLPGYTTRRLSAQAKAVCVAFAEAGPFLKANRIEITGNPLRASFKTVDRTTARQEWDLDHSRPTLLVFGGSAGAKSINQTIAKSISALTTSYNLIWQTGKSGLPLDVDQTAIGDAQQAKRLIVRDFIHNMPSAYAVSDLAICRSGAMTLAELAMAGVPAILVPYPFATDDHQTANAKSVADKGAAILIRDANFTSEALLSAMASLTMEQRQSMSARMASLARPDAALKIADLILANVRQA
jgi:UDP-N-acetylglucosamine--N-acetylmuramyl-(pentapeptide) pyrophosphoryl-undecaprenol N-acetylglucosamine transferase